MQMIGEARETATPLRQVRAWSGSRSFVSGDKNRTVVVREAPREHCSWLRTNRSVFVCCMYYSLHSTWPWLKITFKTRHEFPTLDFTSLRRCTLRVCSASENSYDLKQKYSKWKSRQRLYVRREVGSMWTINMRFPLNNAMRFSSTINRL